jgi:excisionase family DNA binding protein
MNHSIDGPDKYWLTKEEAAAYLGIKETLFDKMVKDGEMPKPHKRGSLPRWYWFDLVAYAHVFGRGEEIATGEVEDE